MSAGNKFRVALAAVLALLASVTRQDHDPRRAEQYGGVQTFRRAP